MSAVDTVIVAVVVALVAVGLGMLVRGVYRIFKQITGMKG
jgi:hypothetical protein